MSSTLRTYYKLTKPGIIRGNVIVAIGAFLLGSGSSIEWTELGWMILGLSLVIASACVYNNVIDRDIDAKMQRTEKRALVVGDVKVRTALVYATVLLVFGLFTLAFGNNLISALVALFGHFAYVVLYGIGKRQTVHGTLIGSVSGSIPPVVGYVAASGTIDIVAVMLFIVLTAWQMPHFYAIATYRKDDYKKAGLPILSVVKGIKRTQYEIIFYILLFIFTIVAMFYVAPVGYSFLAVMVPLGLWWIAVALKGFDSPNTIKWAKSVFGISLIVLLGFSASIGVAAFLP